MGRNAKPIQLHLVDKKKHLTKAEIDQRLENEIKPKTDKIRCPSWLDKVARSKWNSLVKELKELDLMTNIDIDALATYCDAYSQYVECTAIIREEGLMVEYTNKAAETNKVPHPLLTKKVQLHNQMRSLANEFGLTPASRAKLAMPKKEKEVDPFGDVFG
jgi:P27 family predicted phage terminase small subunit